MAKSDIQAINESTDKVVTRDDFELPGVYVAPRNSIERDIAEIWSRELDVFPIGLDDDFFNLGGDSLSATNIAVAIGQLHECKFEPAMLFEQPTVREVATWLDNRETKPTELPSCLIAVKSGNNLPPLFLIHGNGGLIFPKPDFMSGFDVDQPVYAFQAPGYDGAMEPLDSVEAVAKEYCSAMLKVQPSGPWFLGAFCNGSWIAVEIVRLLEARGQKASFVVLLDPGAMNGSMKEEYLVWGDRLSSSNVPLLSPAWRMLKRFFFWASRRGRCFWNTGRWKDYKAREAYQSPAVASWIISRRSKKTKTLADRARSNLKWPDTRQPKVSTGLLSKLDHFSNETAVYATAKMQTAFWNHNPKQPSEYEYDLIISSSRREELRDPRHPVNQVMKNARIIESGETHMETVGGYSAQNSKFMQGKIMAVVKGVAEVEIGEKFSTPSH